MTTTIHDLMSKEYYSTMLSSLDTFPSNILHCRFVQLIGFGFDLRSEDPPAWILVRVNG